MWNEPSVHKTMKKKARALRTIGWRRMRQLLICILTDFEGGIIEYREYSDFFSYALHHPVIRRLFRRFTCSPNESCRTKGCKIADTARYFFKMRRKYCRAEYEKLLLRQFQNGAKYVKGLFMFLSYVNENAFGSCHHL